MGILSNGIIGEVTGKTGPVVTYMRFGQNITRSKGSTRKNKIETPARRIQREKIRVCNEFTHSFSGTGFFNKSFPAYGHTGSGYNRVTSSIMNLAIITNPVVAIAWHKLLRRKVGLLVHCLQTFTCIMLLTSGWMRHNSNVLLNAMQTISLFIAAVKKKLKR